MSEARIAVRLQPRASRDELVGVRDGVLHARVCAAPVHGAANRALLRTLRRTHDYQSSFYLAPKR